MALCFAAWAAASLFLFGALTPRASSSLDRVGQGPDHGPNPQVPWLSAESTGCWWWPIASGSMRHAASRSSVVRSPPYCAQPACVAL
jgi:hypothetical protein